MAGGLAQDITSWESQGLGIVAVTLLLDGPNNGPPSQAGAQTWRDTFGLNGAYVAPDPTFSMVPGNSVGTPQITVIDPRTMQVVHLQEGWGGSHPQILFTTAQQNM